MPNPPFQPIQFPTTVPGVVPGGGWNTYTGPQEDGASLYANNGAVRYNGQNQTSKINTANPMPPWELGPGPADPNISNVRVQAPAGNGYAPIPQGQVGIGVGNPVTVGPNWPPAHLRFFRGADGNLYALDNNNKSYVLSPSATVPVPGVYATTK